MWLMVKFSGSFHLSEHSVCCQIWMLVFSKGIRTRWVCSLLPVKFGRVGVGGLSSAPIVLERDDLIGKCFMDNYPIPPC